MACPACRPTRTPYFNTIIAANANYDRIMLSAQHQAATFFQSDGRQVVPPAPTEFWEVPIRTPAPETRTTCRCVR